MAMLCVAVECSRQVLPLLVLAKSVARDTAKDVPVVAAAAAAE